MINVLYFARLREQLDTATEKLEFSGDIDRIDKLKTTLAGRGGVWSAAFGADAQVLCALNQQMADDETPVTEGDEIAFFPPVTGG